MLTNVLGMFLCNTVFVVSLYSIENRKINIKDKNFYLSIILLNLVSFTLMNLGIKALKPWVNAISLFTVDTLILKNAIKKSILKVVIISLILMIIELFLLLVVSVLFNVTNGSELLNLMNSINNSDMYSFIYNLSGIIIMNMLLNTKLINSIYTNSSNLIDRNFKKRTIIVILSILIIIFLTYEVFLFSNKVILNIVMIIVLVIIISIIYFRNLKVRFEYDETKKKYLTSIQSLLEYEEMIDKYRVNNHENKNQLLTIQNMIKHNDKKVSEYIDNLVGTVYMPNEKTMMDVSIIPSGGLRATIHTKLNIMDNKEIKYNLNIDRKIRVIDFDEISQDLNLKICKIVSIFIDNAIDEVDTHDDSKILNIEMYLEDEKLIIEVSNKFKNDLDLNKLYEKKYTTKSNGHGYGLPLAKELVDSERDLSNYQKIEDDIFTQVLEIKIKK